MEQKGTLLSPQKMSKCLQKLFNAVVNEISQFFQILGKSGSEFSYFIADPRNFAEVIRLSYDIKKNCLKVTLKDIKI